jgi:hypothetical protein
MTQHRHIELARKAAYHFYRRLVHDLDCDEQEIHEEIERAYVNRLILDPKLSVEEFQEVICTAFDAEALENRDF